MTIVDRAARTLEVIRTRRPRVHCVTNNAAHVLTANMLLAIGAVPSLTTARDEIGDFVASADGLLINLGTLDEARLAAIDIGVAAARAADIPWLLDPVFCDRSTGRVKLAATLAGSGPAIIRANAGELDALSAALGAADADSFARDLSTVLVCSGAQDLITDGTRQARVDNGHSFMSQSTAIGCAGTAVMAAFAACGEDMFEAAAAAMVAMGVAGEIAGEASAGPGTFVPHLIDALHGLDADQLTMKARVS